jgi:hypothetical protein
MAVLGLLPILPEVELLTQAVEAVAIMSVDQLVKAGSGAVVTVVQPPEVRVKQIQVEVEVEATTMAQAVLVAQAS